MSIATVAQYERRVRAHHKPERVKIFVSLVWETTRSSWPLIANRSVVSVHASRRGVVATATARCVGTLPERYRRFSPAASDDFKPWPADRKAAPGHVTTRARDTYFPTREVCWHALRRSTSGLRDTRIRGTIWRSEWRVCRDEISKVSEKVK